MSLAHLLEPTSLITSVALALSIFNLVAFLWLTLTVWLNGDRRAGITRLGVVGLGLSAFFFYVHAMLLFRPFPGQAQWIWYPTWYPQGDLRLPLHFTNGGLSIVLNLAQGLSFQDILWHLLWIPGLGVPYIWFTIGLHYAALISGNWRRRRPKLLIFGAVLCCIVLALLVLNRSMITFVGTLRLLAYGDPGSSPIYRGSVGLLTSLVLLPLLFLCYVTFCAVGPWFTPSRIKRLLKVLWYAIVGGGVMNHANSIHTQANHVHTNDAHANQAYWNHISMGRNILALPHALADAFWDDPADPELLEEPILSWHLARPGLLLAALLMAGFTTTLGIFGVHSLLDWLSIEEHRPLSAPAVLTTIPLNLLVLDLLATGAVALIILLVGYSIVRYGVLIERPLARRGFLEQWRGTVIVATTVAILIVLLVSLTRSTLGGLLLITSLATVAYALFTWSNYTAHERFIALLGPFLDTRSTGLHDWLNTDLQKTEQGLESLFFHLCQDVLAVQCARLVVIAGSLRHSFNYRWPEGAKINGVQLGGTTGEIAKITQQAKDAVNGRQMTGMERGSFDIQAHRLRMMVDGQPMICWVLPMYDERGLMATLYLGPRQDGAAFTDEDMDLAHACGLRILDTLGNHEAMQAVTGLLRHRIVDVKLLGAQQRRVLHDEILPQMHLALLRLETLRSSTDGVALDEAIAMISDAHRRLAAMMRATVPSAPHRLERDGLMHAIHTMLEQDFQNVFDEVEWRVTDETVACIDEITPPAIAELIFAAVQEALRNAARHARGSDVHRRLRLTLKASCDPHLEVVVADNGVGVASADSSTTGTGGGLLTHGALLAIAGGSLTVKSAPGEGVTVRIFLPAEAIR
jgi:signal transduction histidine kinase